MLQANLVSVFMQMQNSAAQEVRAAMPPASQACPLFSVGQVLTATILSQLDEGLYLADIEGQPIQLSLAAKALSGDAVFLRVLRAPPDLVFELLHRGIADTDGEPQPSAALSQGAKIIQLALGDAKAAVGIPGLMVRAPLLAAAPEVEGSAMPSMSSAPLPARAASRLPVSVVQSAESVSGAPAQQLAGALRDAVIHSGLFYESHLAQWIVGRRTLADLRREPQAQWHARPVSSEPEATPTARDGAGAATAGAGARTSEPGASIRLLPEEGRSMLRQQMETLESRQIAWQGRLWPEQGLSLRIGEDGAGEHASRPGEESARAWRTTLDLRLPRLGAIHANLQVTGDALSLRVAAPDAEAVRILRADLPALADVLRAAGLRPQSIAVTGDA